MTGPHGPRGDDTAAELLEAVRNLTTVVMGVDQLLRDEYPKRSEVERKFVTKMQQKTHVTRMVVVALVTVVGCYAMSSGVYAACFVGQENPSVCQFAPGYDERKERSREIDTRFGNLDDRLKKLEGKRNR